MELTYNNNNAFFNITCKDFTDKTNVIKLLNENLISFNVVEELGKITTGTLTVLDKQNLYSKILRYGMEFSISWGYRKWNSNLITPTSQLNGSSFRQGLRGIIQNPSGGGNEGGEVTYSVNFYSSEILAQKKVKSFETGTKATVVRSLFLDLGISNALIKINTQDRNYKLSSENVVRQNESSFAFLKKLAVEWHCTLHIGYDRAGRKVGLFIDSKQGNTTTVKGFLALNGFLNSQKTLYYNNGDLSNVRSYSWQNHIGDSGQGFLVKMDYVSGTYIFQRYVAKTQSLISYKLNQDRIAEYVKEHQTQSAALISEIINAQSYDSRIGEKTVQWFFDKVNETTAPDGLGYTVECSMIGDPFIMPTLEIVFGDNFTSELRVDKTRQFRVPIYFTVRKCTHRFSRAGYFTDLEVVDSYILNQGFLQSTTPLQAVQ
jgi:hypothetical protein